MPIRGSFSLNNASDVLSALNRYLQYKEVPANIHIDTLWKAAYEILLNMAGNRALYGSFINKLQGELTPNDIVHMVIMRAKAKMENREHEAPIGFDYGKNIRWIWNDQNKKYKNKLGREETGIDLDARISHNHHSVEESIIHDDCVNWARKDNELGYSAARLKKREGHDNDSIHQILGEDPLTIATAYFQFICEASVCSEPDERKWWCCLELKDSQPELFKTIAVEEMKYKPKTKAYDILNKSQSTYSNNLSNAKKLIAQCMGKAGPK